MKARFIQRDETRYGNNEFSNMPSIDYGCWRSKELTQRTKSEVDWDKVKEICDKHGFSYCCINATFCGDDSDFLVYKKLAITEEKYQEMRKDDSQEGRKKFWDFYHFYDDVFLKLHECVHELDEQTELMFECSWHGNCGLFGSDDVRRMSYCCGGGIVSWRTIDDRWSPLIHDTNRQLSKGVYILMYTRYIKPKPQDSPSLEDMEKKVLDIAKGLISDDYVVSYEEGKRQSDGNSEPYKAMIVRYKSDNSYCRMIRLSRDWLGRYKIYNAAPLCGECTWDMDWENPTEDIKAALGKCA